ncbi:MAG: hypothetical protein JSS91_13110 [Bacteroidetes bacterium]|nr:hypothetical protein [Bacteroidota bacterium]
MILRIIIVSLSILFTSQIRSQELYIVSKAAASLSKDRVEIRNNVMSYDNFKYYHNSFELNYGILGNLTLYNHIYYTTETGNKFFGNYEAELRYRFLNIDRKNAHFRMAFQTAALIPVNAQPIVGDQVEYELHPGHIVKFYNFVQDITVPSIDFHTTDNYTFSNSLIGTYLVNKFAATVEMGYNVNVAKKDFKFGNYYNWNLALGLLVLPREYKSYNDVNINVYSESKAYYFEKNKFLGSAIVNSGGFRLDTYLGVQAIFLSSIMAELSYKIPVHSNEFAEINYGTRTTGLLFSLRYLFFL